jgi:AcrR family transcriptional regulator
MRNVKDPIDRKNELILAATELFLSIGYEKTTVEGIIKKVGVAKGCFYHHYRSKDEIFEECISRLVSGLYDTMNQILFDNKKSPKQKLYDYIEYSFLQAEEHHQSEIMDSFKAGPLTDLHERLLEESIRRSTPLFMKLIEDGIAAKEFEVLDAGFSAVALLGAYKRIHTMYHDYPETDLKAQRVLVYDLTERILKTKF